MLTAAALGLAILGGRWGLLLVASAVAALAGGELLRLIRARGVRPAAPVALAGTLALLLLAHIEGERGPGAAPAVITAILMLSFVYVMVTGQRKDALRAVAFTLVPVLAVGLLTSYVVALRNMPEGFRLTAVLVAMVLGAETLGSLADSKREGSGGGWQRIVAGEVGVMLVVLIVGLSLGSTFTWPTLIVTGALVGVAAPVGRLSATMIGRDLRPADGDIVRLPLLIRVDGLLLAAPIFFYVFRAMSR